jgi:hypothetical protein
MPKRRHDRAHAPPASNARELALAPSPSALAPLIEAYCCAQSLGRDIWEFAVEIRCLREAGLSHTDLRWLLAHGWIAQAQDNSRPARQRRTLRRVANLSLAESACFVLTEIGKHFSLAQAASASNSHLAKDRPSWDAVRRELRLGKIVLKRFKQPAPNQQIILDAFEEEGWPPLIDDPLPPHADQDAKRRLHSTIDNLNRAHERRLVQFHGGGNGQSVGWRLCQ